MQTKRSWRRRQRRRTTGVAGSASAIASATPGPTMMMTTTMTMARCKTPSQLVHAQWQRQQRQPAHFWRAFCICAAIHLTGGRVTPPCVPLCACVCVCVQDERLRVACHMSSRKCAKINPKTTKGAQASTVEIPSLSCSLPFLLSSSLILLQFRCNYGCAADSSRTRIAHPFDACNGNENGDNALI